MGIEFLLIQATVFLGLLALTTETRWWTRDLKSGGLFLLFALYLGVALNNLSGWSVVSFAYLTLAKLATFRWHRIDDSELIGSRFAGERSSCASCSLAPWGEHQFWEP